MPIHTDDRDDQMLRETMDRLRIWMKAADLNQSEVARRIHYHQTNISNWFNATESRGKRQEPRLVPILKIAQTFGVSLDWLATGRGAMLRDTHGGPGLREARGAALALSKVEVAVAEIRKEFEPSEPAPAVPADVADRLVRARRTPKQRRRDG